MNKIKEEKTERKRLIVDKGSKYLLMMNRRAKTVTKGRKAVTSGVELELNEATIIMYNYNRIASIFRSVFTSNNLYRNLSV